MITNPAESLTMLRSFFENDLSTLDIPELVTMENQNVNNHSTNWNALILNETNNNLKTINFPNLEQTPYIVIGKNLTNINLEHLRMVEISDSRNSNFIDYNNLQPQIICNTKIQTLNLPYFVGSPSPTSRINSDISSTDVSHTSFWDNYWLTDVVFGNSTIKQSDFSNFQFNGFWFKNSYFLKSLRLYYPYVIPIYGSGGLDSTPIGKDNGNGFIYVPDDLVYTYQHTEGWQSFATKIQGLSFYTAPNVDTITDSWETISENCRRGSTSNYPIGGTKSIEIDGVQTQFILVGKNQDQLYTIDNSYNTNNAGRAALTWAERTISRFNKINISNNFSEGQISYREDIVFHNYLKNNIYNKIPESVRQYIKPVVKYAKGFSGGQPSNNIATKTGEEYIWPLSQRELGIGQSAENTFIYNYFDLQINPNTPTLNYYLGDTLNNNGVLIALRDYDTTGQSSPTCLQPATTAGERMTTTSSNYNPVYTIVGFCT